MAASAKGRKASSRGSGKGASTSRASKSSRRPAPHQRVQAPGNGAATNLVVVESPAKARTIGRILGDGFVVKASQGHVRDLPKGKLGVEIDGGFEPSYRTLSDKRSVVQELQELGKRAPVIYLATDPDREGEAISWHLVEAAGWGETGPAIHRVVFHEITPEAVKEAFDHPRAIDMELVNSQQARRILDRLVGYQISPLLWRKVQRGLSAGRVQSVALRMVVDREKEIEAFRPKEYWTIEAQLKKQDAANREKAAPFGASLRALKGHKGKLSISNEPTARAIWVELQGAHYVVAGVDKKEVRESPSPPFITSTLQQEAWRKLRFSARKAMAAAQQLYEGLPIGQEGSVGLITYMRTDSTHVAPSALQETREHIGRRFGREYLPKQARLFRKKAKGAQEAHEAIRPTSVLREPEPLKGFLSSDQYRLYELIWRRAVASQMSESRSDSTTVDTDATCKGVAKVYIFRSSGSVIKFPGFRAVYLEGKDEAEDEQGKGPLPQLSVGQALDCLGLETKQHFTQPPQRYTEASLIKMLEENGIGRPSTYAPIISTILDRQYVVKESSRLKPTVLGDTVCNLLTQHFSDIMGTNFTARMEEELDEVAQGRREWVPMLRDFYGPFEKSLKLALEKMPRVKVEEATEEVCEKCGQPMVIKTGRFGRFMACSNYPTCKNTRPLAGEAPREAAAGQPGQQSDGATEEVCEKCGQPMVIKTGRFGRFIACSNYPTCKNSRPLKTGAPCPKCGGDLVQRFSRARRRAFYGCARYPDCDFIVNQRPLPVPCPECGGLMVSTGQGVGARCTNCAWKQDMPETELATANP